MKIIQLEKAIKEYQSYSYSPDSFKNAKRHPRNSIQIENANAQEFSFFGNQTWDILAIMLNYIDNPNALNIRDAKRIQKQNGYLNDNKIEIMAAIVFDVYEIIKAK